MDFDAVSYFSFIGILMADRTHPESAPILARLKREGITALYHFTCVENLRNICQIQAVCSKQTLVNLKRWPPPVAGGNALSHNLDRTIGNWDKVSLNLTSHTPMVFYRKRELHLCFFVVRPEVAAWRGVVFTDSNAAKTTNQIRGVGLAGLNNIKFEAIRALPRPWDRDGWVRPVQAEVLVPDQIPLEFVSQVVFVSKASCAYAERLCNQLSHPPFVVDKQLFADISMSTKWTVDFPHVIELILTDGKIDESVVHLTHVHKNRYSRLNSSRLTAVALVQAAAGTKAEVRWRPINISSTTEFATSDQYHHWPHIALNRLPDGVCSVEYYLNDVLWTATNFEVFR